MNPLLVFAALLPAVILLVRVYRLDKIEKEPARVLWKLVAIGAVSGLVAGVVELALCRLLGRFLRPGTLAYIAVENFLIIALVEEFCKRLPVRRFFWNDAAFDYRFDAVVYCVFSALGFAALENVFYVADGGLSTAVTRALLSVPGHFFFAVYMGVYLGEAKKAELNRRFSRRKGYLHLSLWVPVLMHGFWDFCLSFHSLLMTVLFYGFVLVFFFHASRLLRKTSAEDERMRKG